MIAALKGYRMKLLMPDNMSQERRAAMRAYGAELILVTKEQGMDCLLYTSCLSPSADPTRLSGR